MSPEMQLSDFAILMMRTSSWYIHRFAEKYNFYVLD